MNISIVLLTLNGMPTLELCLEQISRQRLKSQIEIIHIDSGSTDDTLAAARSFSLDTLHIPSGHFHHSSTRNHAASLAKNEVVVFLSQDAIPTNETWLANLVAPFEDASVGAVYGRQIPDVSVGPVRRCAMSHLYPSRREVRDPSHTSRFNLAMCRFSDANSAVRRDLLERFKFDERALVCEDHGMCRDILSAGYKVVYEPEAAVIHGHERDLLSEFGWSVDNGISLTRMGILGNSSGDNDELRYGLRCAQQQLEYFARRQEFRNLVVCLANISVRWLGVQIGKREKNIPEVLMRACSPSLRRLKHTRSEVSSVGAARNG
jgi:rhamnosyltransferase